VKLLLSMGILTLVATGAARATELCVKCTEPDASYACVVGGVSNATLDTVAKFYCITTLAKAGSHASCSIDRSMTAPCPGIRKELAIPAFLNGSDAGDQQQDASSPRQNHTNSGSQEANIPPAPTGSGPAVAPTPNMSPNPPTNEQPPKTVQEMMEKSANSAGAGITQTQKSAGDAAKSASTALEKAGSAVGGAAKSSWKCLSSFFSNC
jgi:hypothetical protein